MSQHLGRVPALFSIFVYLLQAELIMTALALVILNVRTRKLMHQFLRASTVTISSDQEEGKEAALYGDSSNY